jgi:hypothetical protein
MISQNQIKSNGNGWYLDCRRGHVLVVCVPFIRFERQCASGAFGVACSWLWVLTVMVA